MSEVESYGPLQSLIGSWSGSSGLDLSPESDGVEENIYRETIVFEPIGEVVNAESERLMVLSYRQQVFRIRGGKRIHDQHGYWMWNDKEKSVIHSFVIPRGVSVIAGGVCQSVSETASDGQAVKIDVSAESGGEWPISETAFMRDNAQTLNFKMQLEVDGDELKYKQATNLNIYGSAFEHTEESTLTRD